MRHRTAHECCTRLAPCRPLHAALPQACAVVLIETQARVCYTTDRYCVVVSVFDAHVHYKSPLLYVSSYARALFASAWRT